MTDIREAAKVVGESLYGENAEISELQLLFSMTELHRMKKEIQKINKPNIFDEIDVDIDQVASDLEKEIDRRMPEPGSPDYNKFLSMKAYSFNLRSHNKSSGPDMINLIPAARPEFLEKTLELLEPIKLEPVAVYFYVDALNLLGTRFLFSDNKKSIEYLLKAEVTYKDFVKKFTDAKKAMTPYQVFDVPREIQTLWCLLTAHHYTSIFLYSAYTNIQNETMKLKYAIHSIRGKLSIELSEKNKFFAKKIVPAIMDEINLLIQKWHFAQVNHLLAGFMTNLVDYRRSLPEESRSEVDFQQGLLSLAYASWAYEVVHYSCLELEAGQNEEIDEPVYHYQRFDDLVVPGIEVYENQFPCHRIDSHKKMKSTLKKGKAWCQRAIDMIDNTGNTFLAKELMTQLEILEHDLEFFKGKK